MNDLRLVIITGLSGAGKSQALRSLEDLGFFCIDNLPPALVPKFAELWSRSGDNTARVALVIDARGGVFFDDLFEALRSLEEEGIGYSIVFLEASDETLVRRFKETRRRHPLAPHSGILDGIKAERKKLEEIRGHASLIVDTTNLTPQRLREEMFERFSGEPGLERFVVSLTSFGFKRGLPRDADLVFDVRFLPNPFYVESLREKHGKNAEVEQYVLKWPVTKNFLRRLDSLIRFLIPYYKNEGKTHLAIAIGCTGGRHRSVVVANRLGELLRARKHTVIVDHRDIEEEDGE